MPCSRPRTSATIQSPSATAQGVEELGLDHLITYDHVLGADHADRDPPLTGPYTERDAFHEPFVLFGYLAAVTRRLELVIGVLVLPQRQTALVAKQAAEVALLSGGRLRLGIGSGWNWVEYDALGVPFRARGRRLEEQVDVLRRLWTEPLVTLHGAHHDIERPGSSHAAHRSTDPIPGSGRRRPHWQPLLPRVPSDRSVIGGPRCPPDSGGPLGSATAYLASRPTTTRRRQDSRDAGAHHFTRCRTADDESSCRAREPGPNGPDETVVFTSWTVSHYHPGDPGGKPGGGRRWSALCSLSTSSELERVRSPRWGGTSP